MTSDSELHTQIQYRLIEQLSESEKRYRELVESLYEVVFETDSSGRLTFLNSAWTYHLGYTVIETLGVKLEKLIHADDLNILTYLWEKAIPGSAIKGQELRFYSQSQSVVWFELSARFQPGKGLSGSLVNITEQKQARERLEQQVKQEQLLAAIAQRIRQSLNLDEIFNTTATEIRQLFQTDWVLVYQFKPDWTGVVVVESVDSQCTSLLGHTMTNPCCFHGNQGVESLIQESSPAIADLPTADIKVLTQYEVKANLVMPILRADHLWGLLIVQHCSEPRIWHSREIELLRQITTHVSIAIQQSQLYEQLQSELNQREQGFFELKQVQKQLETSLHEKEILLKEIHHRVKNNLLVVASLLDLQAAHLENETITKVFEDSQQRIYSMALIHEKLYQSKHLDKVDLSEYLATLAKQIAISLEDHRNIQFQFHLQPTFVNVETAVPCGLIVNELICNIFEHAFPNRFEGTIKLRVDQSDYPQITIVIQDDGVGLPKEIDFRKTESLGLQLVCLLTKQLGGNMQLSVKNGTAFQLRFSELRYCKRF
jgi:PAS domain S-box-containing protein